VSEMGHKVVAAPDAESGAEAARNNAIDVAVCDVRMPGHDGIWLVDQVQQHDPDVAVVMATGLLELDPTVTLRPGVVGYIVKPFTREELVSIVKLGLKERQRMRERDAEQLPLLASAFFDAEFVKES